MYAIPKVNTYEKLEKIPNIICIENGSKFVLVGDFNHDFNEQKDFVKALRVEDLEIKTNAKYFPTRGHTRIDDTFSNKTFETHPEKMFC